MCVHKLTLPLAFSVHYRVISTHSPGNVNAVLDMPVKGECTRGRKWFGI